MAEPEHRILGLEQGADDYLAKPFEPRELVLRIRNILQRVRQPAPAGSNQVVLTHLHTDHAGGLSHLTGSKIWVSRQELARASGFGGKVQGYLPHRWPKWWQPECVRFENRSVGPFRQSMSVTSKGDVLIVPPGVIHGWFDSPDHVDYISFRPSHGVMKNGWVNPTIASK